MKTPSNSEEDLFEYVVSYTTLISVKLRGRVYEKYPYWCIKTLAGVPRMSLDDMEYDVSWQGAVDRDRRGEGGMEVERMWLCKNNVLQHMDGLIKI